MCGKLNLYATYSSSDGTVQITNNGNIPISKTMISIESAGEIDTISNNKPILAGSSVSISGIPFGESMDVIPIILGDVEGVRETYTCEDNSVEVEIL